MPAPHWSILPLAVAAAGLFRRRAAADGAEAVVPRRSPAEEFLSLRASDLTVQGYAYAGCTDREIADRFGLTEADVRATYAEVLTKSRAGRAFALRKAQTDLAAGPPGGGKAAGNGTMLTWLGRNELGQSLSPTARGEPEPNFDE